MLATYFCTDITSNNVALQSGACTWAPLGSLPLSSQKFSSCLVDFQLTSILWYPIWWYDIIVVRSFRHCKSVCKMFNTGNGISGWMFVQVHYSIPSVLFAATLYWSPKQKKYLLSLGNTAGQVESGDVGRERERERERESSGAKRWKGKTTLLLCQVKQLRFSIRWRRRRRRRKGQAFSPLKYFLQMQSSTMSHFLTSPMKEKVEAVFVVSHW